MAGFFIPDRTPLPVVAYAIYLYLSGLSLRKVGRAIWVFAERSHEAVRLWLSRFSRLGEALHPGRARVAVADEICIRVSGSQAWAWLAMEPKSRRLLAIRLSWTRNNLVAYAFLRHLKSRCGIRVVVADGAPWYRWACMELGLRLHVERGGGLSLLERLNKEVNAA